MLHAKTLHYPSGIPLQRSPPLFSSPGPDPYRSHDNVYEELEHRNGIVVGGGGGNVLRANQLLNCDRDLHSDEEDFAEDEDECSLPGDRSFNKSSSDNTTVATIYQEHSGGGGAGGGSGSNSGNENGAMYRERNRAERNSLLSSASSSALESAAASAAVATRPNLRNSSSSNESSNLYHHTLNNHHHGGSSSGGGGSNGNGSSFFRFRTARPNRSKSSKTKTDNFSMYNINSATNVVRAGGGGEMKDNSGNGGIGPSLLATQSNNDSMSSNNPFNGNHIEIGDTNNNGGRNGTCEDGIDDEVERLNRRNAQLSNPSAVLNVATIFRDRNHYHNNPMRANANYYAPPQHIMMSKRTNNINNSNNNNSERARTNPRIDRRRHNSATRESAVNNNNMQEYLYHEPVYHDNVVYDPYMTTSPSSTYDNDSQNQIYHHPYMMPEFTSSFRNYNNLNNPHQPLYNTAAATAAMGSDSGYSQNTQNSGRSLWSRRKRNGNNGNNNNSQHFLPTASTVRDDLGNS